MQIKDRFNSNALFSSDTAKDMKALVLEAIKAGANLSRANLAGANLAGANLAGAKGIPKILATPLLAMLQQPGVQRWFKIVGRDYQSPTQSIKITYTVGETVTVPDADTDPDRDCGAGINVATLDWLYKEYKLFSAENRAKYRLLAIDCEAKDIACIPNGTTGKVRLKKGMVFSELNINEVFN